jgi:hypothetical protein
MAIQNTERACGIVLPMALLALVILSLLGMGLLSSTYGVRLQAIRARKDLAAMLAAEAGYEKAVFWMSQQADILSGLQDDASGASGTIDFGHSNCAYTVQFHDYIGARPVFRATSIGVSGPFSRAVDVYVIQKISGWDMGMCRVPADSDFTYPVYFAEDEIIDMRLHINNHHDSPDERDIYISGTPQFLQKVQMGEDRYTVGGTDKYAAVLGLFEGGISYNQPDIRITDETAVEQKVQRFDASTKPSYRFSPVGLADILRPHAAVQLEFFVDGSVGKVRITDNCTVRGYRRFSSSQDTWDYKVVSDSGGQTYEKYDIYAYHYIPDSEVSVTTAVEDTYVKQVFGGCESEPGGQIFVDGNVVIGSEDYDVLVVKGKITVVATGHIWIADSIVVDGPHDPLSGLPTADNPNVLGLIALGVVKVVDPGLSSYPTGSPNYYPGLPSSSVPDATNPELLHSYAPVCNGSGSDRYLPEITIVEAAITVGGGGWGAENVRRGSYGGRQETTGNQDLLVVRGTIAEVIRGVVGLIDLDGFIKQYYLDDRLLEGVLPGNIWFGGKFVPAPAGWRDYQPEG